MNDVSERTQGQLLTAQQIADFEEKGFHLIRSALTPEEVAMYRDSLIPVLATPADHPYARRLLKASVPGAPPTAINTQGIWAGFDLPLFDDVFLDFAFQSKIVLTLCDLLGPDVNLYETSFVSKVPGFPGNYRDWHQDSEYSDPQSNDSLVTVITYLDDQDGQSGGTWVAPGTHKGGAIAHQVPAEEVTSGAREVVDKAYYDSVGFCPQYQAGDTLVFKARLVHKSGSNASDRDRLSLAYNYCRADTLDLQQPNYYIGASTPVARGGAIYRMGQTAADRLKARTQA